MENDIYENNDGIIMFDSSPLLFKNEIHENQRAGVIVSGSSFPKLDYNNIFGNTTSGIIIRDTSLIQTFKNTVRYLKYINIIL
jgi:parallel beta-helix repeat protein